MDAVLPQFTHHHRPITIFPKSFRRAFLATYHTTENFQTVSTPPLTSFSGLYHILYCIVYDHNCFIDGKDHSSRGQHVIRFRFYKQSALPPSLPPRQNTSTLARAKFTRVHQYIVRSLLCAIIASLPISSHTGQSCSASLRDYGPIHDL